MRIRIVGGSGSGKTTLAKRLAEKYKIPHYDMDDMYWEKDNPRPEKERDRIIKSIVSKKNWVIEGVYTKEWNKPTFDNAEQIIILKTRPIVRTLRITKRFARRKLGLQRDKKEKLSSYLQDLKEYWEYDNQTLKRLDQKKHKRKIITLHNKKDIERYLRT